ncbi:MAG: hypothetical protein ACKVS9_15040 [Phycisphaerae bacterium]
MAALLVDLGAYSDEEADEYTFEQYRRLYLDRSTQRGLIGIRKAHDGSDVYFAESRYEHAFGTPSEKTSRRYAKDMFDRARGERVAWIGPVIAGNILGVECWSVPPKNGRRDIRGRQPNRLYLFDAECYVVWLEPRRDGGYWFATAYVAGFGDLRRYRRSGRLVWAQKNTP